MSFSPLDYLWESYLAVSCLQEEYDEFLSMMEDQLYSIEVNKKLSDLWNTMPSDK